ncbi:MAG: iodotyrosine deiodinase [Sphingobacteriales bacterium]|jgi:iodotyrosine deiodinase
MIFPFIPYKTVTINKAEQIEKVNSLFDSLNSRRSVRDFSTEAISQEVLEKIVMTASTAPSGAHKQPWTFCIVTNKNIKSAIRKAAEDEEKISYGGRMSERWLKDLAPLGTDWKKPFLEEAPALVIVFKRVYEMDGDEKANNYYVNESVGVACGMLISAIHNAGLVTLTHTPSPMDFLAKILNRPKNERPYLLLPVGYPKSNATVPDIHRKSKKEVICRYD